MCIHMFVHHVFIACGGKKRMLDSLELELQTVVSRYWELNPIPLEDQTVLLTYRPSFQALPNFLDRFHSSGWPCELL